MVSSKNNASPFGKTAQVKILGWTPRGSMGDVYIRHIIQVKEKPAVSKKDKPPIFFDQFGQCDCDWYPTDPHAVFDTPEHMIKRCSKHNTELMKWRRKEKFRNKWEREFKKNYKRWRFVKMLTITLPGYMHIEIPPGYDPNDYTTYLKNEVLTRFKKLQRCKYWTDHVDGGQWFFECPIKNNKTNPHFHILLVGPKLINQVKLQEKLEHYNLGKIAKFSSPKNKQGVIQKMTYWRNRKLMLNKSAVKRAINYALKYVTKEEQADGKNNSYFGCLHNR